MCLEKKFKKSSFAIFVLIIIWFVGCAQCLVCYLSTTGSDSNSGTTAGNPVLTLEKCLTIFSPNGAGAYPATIYAETGNYEGVKNVGIEISLAGHVDIIGYGGSESHARFLGQKTSWCWLVRSSLSITKVTLGGCHGGILLVCFHHGVLIPLQTMGH